MTKPRNMRITPLEETEFGVYVWKMPDGRYVGDDAGNLLSINSQKGDLRRISELSAAVRSFGINEGTPDFLAGRRKVSDEEYEEQLARMEAGMLPDEYDIPALVEEMRNRGRS